MNKNSLGVIKLVMIGASLEQNGGIATVERLIFKHCPSDIQIQHITSHDEGSILHRVLVFNFAVISLLKSLIGGKVDLVHIHMSDGGSLLRKAILTFITTVFDKPVLMHTHGAEFRETYSKLPKVIRPLFNQIFRSCSGFIVLSKTWKDFYVSCLSLSVERIIVLPNPTELPDQLPNRLQPKQVNLVFLGRIGQRKGAFDLIQAFAKLSIEHQSKSRLFLAGDGEIEQAQALAESLQIGDKITFLGWIDFHQRNKILEAGSIFVLPSYNEGLPMAILEAMGWQLPIISTPVGGIPELIVSGENGLLINPGDIQQLSDAMEHLIEDEALRLKIGLAARKTVEPFDVQNYWNNLAKIYRSIS